MSKHIADRKHRTGYTVHIMGYQNWHRTASGAAKRARDAAGWASGHIFVTAHAGDETTDHARF